MTTIRTIIIEPTVIQFIKNMSDFWPIDFCGLEVKNRIIKKTKNTNRIYFIISILFSIMGILMLPLFGDQKDLFLCVTVYEHYFGKWAIILYYIYFCLFPLVAYFVIRLAFIMHYCVRHIQVQVYLINLVITKLSGHHKKNISDVRSDKDYQEKVYKKFCTYISHHIMLKM